MQDPSQGVARELLPHVHLLSTYRFPIYQTVHHNKIAEWLLSAPKIARDTAPFFWSYLDRPTDGTIMLTWQPLESLGINFATDGYMWPPNETAFQLEVDGGFTLEMYQHKAGFGPGEQFATHGRRRYRLTTKFPNPSMASPDPALWITHYYTAEPTDRIPSSMIPITDMRTQSLMQTRMYLQTQGQIVQKEFMLHDRQNWPQIQFPRNQVRQGPFPMGTTRTPQVMAYPPHQIGAANLGPPAKRARTQANPPQGSPAAIGPTPPVEVQDDEEDTSRGDSFDHMTPREVSISRYKQNHEWMEEVLSSPYAIHKIVPVDLGLGLRGELGNLTDGIFKAAGFVDDTPDGYLGRLDPAKADEFRKRAAEYVKETNSEMERMKLKHAKRMARFKRNALIAQAELELRSAIHDPTDIGPEYWRLEGRTDVEIDDDRQQVAKIHDKIEEIVAQVEESLGRRIVAVDDLKRVQDGGLEESQPEPTPVPSKQPSPSGSQQSGVLIGEGDLDIGDSAAGLLDQFHTGFSSTSTPGGSFPTPQPLLQAISSAGTPKLEPSPQPSAQDDVQPPVEQTEIAKPTEDVNMDDTAKDGQGTGDWVVIPEGGVSPVENPVQAEVSFPELEIPVPVPTASEPEADIDAGDHDVHIDAEDHAEDLDMDLGDNFNTDANDFGSLEDLDTAGEALAGYGNSDLGDHNGELTGDLDLGMDMGLDDSAFGDAFHGVEPRDGDVEADGL